MEDLLEDLKDVRDKFSCIGCETSPAKDSSVVLHVELIIPWSKGDETNISNLLTMCQDRNLGKAISSDNFFKLFFLGVFSKLLKLEI